MAGFHFYPAISFLTGVYLCKSTSCTVDGTEHVCGCRGFSEVATAMLTKNVDFQIHVFQAFPSKIPFFSLKFERMIVGGTGDIHLMKLFIHLKHEIISEAQNAFEVKLLLWGRID